MLQYGLYGKQISNTFVQSTTAISQTIKPLILIDWLDSRHVAKYNNAEIASSTSSFSTPTTNDINLEAAGMLLRTNRITPTYRSLSVKEIEFNKRNRSDYYFTPNESINGIERQAFTWAVCDAKDKFGKTITANGQWHALPSSKDDNYEFGFVSGVKSTSNIHATRNGYEFSSPVIIQYNFTGRPVNILKVITSEFNGQIKAYNIQAYEDTTTMVFNTDSEILDNSYYNTHYLNSSNINKIVLTIYTTKNPLDRARVNEVAPIYQTDVTDYVMDFNVSKVRDVHETSLPIAGGGSSTCSLKLDNNGKDFNLFSSSSTYGKYMKKDLRAYVYTGWQIQKTNQILINSVLTANISSSSSTITVDTTENMPQGGGFDNFIVTINPGATTQERVLCYKDSYNTLAIVERGFGDTEAFAHSTGEVVRFDPYEYVPCGIFYVDEWQSSSSDMSVNANLSNWNKFTNEKMITNGYFMQESTIAEAVDNLLLRTNFPKKDIDYFSKPSKTYKKDDAILHFGFDEDTVDRASTQRVPSASLRSRFVALPEKQQNTIKDIKLDANDRALSAEEIALDIITYVSPSFVSTSNVISTQPDGETEPVALNYQNDSFTASNGSAITDYYNGVFDGYYIPSSSGVQRLRLDVRNCGVRMFFNKNITEINSWYEISPGDINDTTFVTEEMDLTAGRLYEIRIEFFHKTDDFGIALKKDIEGSIDWVWAHECVTMPSFDYVGSRSDVSYLNFASGSWTVNTAGNFVERVANRNDGRYIGSVLTGQTSGVVSDPGNKSVLLASNSYIRVPYHISYDIFDSSSSSYTNEFSIEVYAKFHNGSFSGTGEYISNWSNATSTSGFEFFNTSSSNGFKFKTSAGTATITSNTALSSSAFTHIGVTYKSNTLKYYINGALANTVTTSGTLLPYTGKDLTIGGRGASFTPETIEAFAIENPPSSIRSFYIDEFAIFKKMLTDEEMKKHYIETQMQPVFVMPFIYGNEITIQALIDTISMADLGRLYIDEYGKARYEHYYRFFEPTIAQHASVQKTFSDDTNIIDASYNVQLQANKVTVKLTGVSTKNNALQGLWSLEDGTTLAVGKLNSNIASNAASIPMVTTDKPYFPKSGYVKLDDEIIRYESKTANSLDTLTRAYFNTVAASHTANTLVREVQQYTVSYNAAPAYQVQNPLISGIFNKRPALVEIIKFEPNAYKANLIVAASQYAPDASEVFLKGVDELNNEQSVTSIAGVPIVVQQTNNDIREQTNTLSDNIRLYGLKEIVIENEFITNLAHAKTIADFLISKMSEPVPVLNITITPTPTIQLGDRIRISSMDSFDIINGDYWVISTEIGYGSQPSQSMVVRKVV
jgi:hypothetical protein